MAIAALPRKPDKAPGVDDDPFWLKVAIAVGTVAVCLLFLGFLVWRVADWLG